MQPRFAHKLRCTPALLLGPESTHHRVRYNKKTPLCSRVFTGAQMSDVVTPGGRRVEQVVMGVCASLIPLGSPHAHTMRVRRMCGEPNEIDVTAIAPLATGSCAPAGGSAAWGGLGGKGCQQFRGGGRSWGVRAGELAESPPPPPHTHTHTHHHHHHFHTTALSLARGQAT